MPSKSKQFPGARELDEAWLRVLPDEAQRQSVARILAGVIQHAHAVAPGTWMISYRPSRSSFNLNVGRIFVVSVDLTGMSFLFDSTVLNEDSFPKEWKGCKPGYRFKVLPEATFRHAPISDVLSEWERIEPAFLSAVDKAIPTASITPWYPFHFNDAVDLIARDASVDLPYPVHPRSREPETAAALVQLIEQFGKSYVLSADGRDHYKKYLDSKQYFRESLDEIRRKRDAREEVTDAILTRLLPHADTTYTRTQNVWRTVAPVITRDMKQLFEGAGWAKKEDWPEIALRVLDFFLACEEDPDSLEMHCSRFAKEVPAKGFQAAILSAGLMALNPDRFSLVNRKPLYLIEHFAGIIVSSDLTEYPRANKQLQNLAELASEALLDIEDLEGLNTVERLDMFSHWLVAVRKWRPGGVRYWKVAPGEQAWNWDFCRENNVITLGWDEYGDVGALSRSEFDAQAKRLIAENTEFKKHSATQVWTFAHEIRPGDRIIANLGMSHVLGIGTVEGEYFFVPGEEHGHRIPVKWENTSPYDVPRQGWRNTIVSLNDKKFKQILEFGANQDGPRAWVFQANPSLFNLEEQLTIKNNAALERWRTTRYYDDIREGDIAILWQAGKNAGIFALAEVTAPPVAATAEDIASDPYIYKNAWFTSIRITRILNRPILKSELLDNPILAETHVIKSPQGTNFRVTHEEWAELKKLIPYQPTDPPWPPIITLEEIAKTTGFDVGELERWVRAIERKKQAVLYGPPGTGKTFIAEYLARYLANDNGGFVRLVQFHPAYTYEDFIQGLRPEIGANGGLDYQLAPGRFLEFCEDAKRRKGTCVLILDEINRANLARVFGELMYLLEYRDQEIPLAGGRTLKVPSNVRIIGTMNTADRSIALVDHALRRRFAFIALRPQYSILEQFHAEEDFNIGPLVDTLRRLNQTIDDPNYEVGISFFMKEKLGDHLEDIWRMEIEPYLEEYFFDQANKVKEFSWDKLASEFE